MLTHRYALTDSEWDRIKDYLPGRYGHVGVTAQNNRLFVEAVIYRYKAGIAWRDLPSFFGNWKSVHKRLRRWCEKAIFEQVFKLLTEDADNEYLMIDSTVVRAHQHAAGAFKNKGNQSIGRSVGGPSTKIHAIVDALGNPVSISLTQGQIHDSKESKRLLETVQTGRAFLADKAYGSQDLLHYLAERSCEAVIPSKSNALNPRDIDKVLYKERNLVERFFCKLKQFRAIATRYDKLASTFLGGVYLAGIIILLR